MPSPSPPVLKSPVLKNLVTEGLISRIELPDVAGKTCEDLLFFLYNNRMEEDSDHVGLLALASKYDIQVENINNRKT